MKSLATQSKGMTGIIKKVRGTEAVRRKVVDLGIVPGLSFEIFTITPKSAMVVILEGTRVIVDMKTSEGIFVE